MTKKKEKQKDNTEEVVKAVEETGTEKESVEVSSEHKDKDVKKEAEKKPKDEKAKTAELEEELKKEKDSYLRLVAEFNNFKKRTQEEKEEFAKFAAERSLVEILPIYDSFERAQKAFEEHKEDTEELIKGFSLIHKQFEDVLKKLNVTKIECIGEAFDPNLHEAIMQQENGEKEANTILDEVQPGYKLGEKIIRHAMVIVSKKPAEKQKEESQEGES
jgi:molecular chaperone GrpE